MAWILKLQVLKTMAKSSKPNEMTEELGEETIKQYFEAIPIKRGGTPEEIANTCVFLGSDMSSYITGQVLNVGGGMLT